MRAKVHYRPLEAAIRWSGLERHQAEILAALSDKTLPCAIDFPQWPSLRLNAERIYDGVLNGELRYALDGVVAPDGSAAQAGDFQSLTVRHVDLRDWLARYYPAQRPSFLFSRRERDAERAAIQINLHFDSSRRDLPLGAAGAQRASSRKRHASPTRSADAPEPGLSERSEMAYLNIVGGLLSVLLGESPSGRPYSSFRTQESIISAMIAHHGQRLGISERTLQQKFAAARRTLIRIDGKVDTTATG